MLQGLTGWHFLIIIGVLVVLAVIVAVIVVAVMAAARAATRRGSSSDPSTRLRTLDALRQNGQIDDAEYARKRQEILGEL
jgi:uncharacterized membrane protein